VSNSSLDGVRARAPLRREDLRLALQFADARHRRLLARHRVARWLRAALDGPAEVTVRIVGAEEGRSLNVAFRGKGYATNVLTFVYESAPTIVADLVLCAGIVEREARERAIAPEAHYAHLIVHGALHAQGLDHARSRDAKAMEGRESAILAGLGFADPYAR
jgi:probable rRNA maturation factor